MNTSPYYQLKAALALFGKPPGALAASEGTRVRAVAQRYTEIEGAVLGSPEAQGVCLADGDIERALGEIRTRYEDEHAFELGLADAGLDLPALTAALRRDLLVDAVMTRVGARAGEVGDTEAEIFYYAHLDRFRTPERRAARHILVTINEDCRDNTRAAARHRIDEIARRLAHKPARFEEQALKHSECPTALDGGRLGEVPRGTLYPALDAALFALAAGEISTVLESELGFHLLRCDAITPERTLSYAEVAPTLRQQLTAGRAHRHARRWLTTLLKRDDAVAAN